MQVIGIAGGIACGKSLVADCFQRLGAEILNVDGIGHDVLKLPEVVQAVRDQWGEDVFCDDGNIDRKSLGRIVFAQTKDDSLDQLEILEGITHPQIARVVAEHLAELRNRDEVPAVILDAPVMFKAGWDKLCDKIVFVDVPLELRQKWALANRGWSHVELALRERRQLPIEEKRNRSTDIIDNTGTPDQLFDRVTDMWKQWGLGTKTTTPPKN